MIETTDMFGALFDEWLRLMVDDDGLDEAAKVQANITALCANPMLLHLHAPSGFDPAFQREGHDPPCPICRSATRVAFRNAVPGVWVLWDRTNESRPQWWRDAINDYLETGPWWFRKAAGRRGHIKIASRITLIAGPAGLAPVGLRSETADDTGPRERQSSVEGEGNLFADLWTCSQPGAQGEPMRREFVVEVVDEAPKRGPRTVQSGLSGKRTVFVDVPLKMDRSGLLRGEATLTNRQVAALLDGEDGEIELLQPFEIPDGLDEAAQ